MQASFRPRRPFLAEVLAVAADCRIADANAVLTQPSLCIYEGGVDRRERGKPDVRLLRFELSAAESWARLIAAGYVRSARYRVFACGLCDGSGKEMVELDGGERAYETCSTCRGQLVYPTPQWTTLGLALASDFARALAFEEDTRGRSDSEIAWRLWRAAPLPRTAADAAKGPEYRAEKRVGQRQWLQCPDL